VSGNIRSGEDPRPPRIPFNQVDPRPGLVVVSDPATQLPMIFRVLQFEEPNLQDTLTVRWFVDYHRNPAIQQQAVRPPEPSSPNPTLRTGSSFTLTLSMLEPSPATDPHLVEVVVSDRPFDDPGQPTQLNRTFAPDALGDVVSWTVQVKTPAPSKPLDLRPALPDFRLPPDGRRPSPLPGWEPGRAIPVPGVRIPPWLRGTEVGRAP
jgi:hypothetical protein